MNVPDRAGGAVCRCGHLHDVGDDEGADGGCERLSECGCWQWGEPLTEPRVGHASGGLCWCQPTFEQDAATGARLFIHRRTADGPSI